MTEPVLEALEQHYEQAFKWAMSCCNYDREEAKDVMQSVYEEILSEKAVFRRESSFATWIFTIIHRIAWKRSSKERKFNLPSLLLSKSEELNAESCDASKELSSQQQSESILVALGNLSVQQKQLIELVYYRDFTIEEAAMITGCRLGTARTHFHRAKKNLAKTLKHLDEC